MADIDYEKLWKEIIDADYAKTHLLPGEKTVRMFAEETNVTIDTARRTLDKYVEEKKVNKRFIHQKSCKVAVYSPIIIAK